MSSPYVPGPIQPTRWQMWRWMCWSPEEPKPEPHETVYVMYRYPTDIPDRVIVSPVMLIRLRAGRGHNGSLDAFFRRWWHQYPFEPGTLRPLPPLTPQLRP